MKPGVRFAAVAALLCAATAAHGQVTRVATFENYPGYQNFKPSFTDALSGITFRDSTDSQQFFSIASNIPDFPTGRYLGAGSSSGWGTNFGFTADLPAPANRVSIDVSYILGDASHTSAQIALRAFNSNNVVVDSAVAPVEAPHPFTLEVQSGAFDIVSIRIDAGGNFTAYDNVSYSSLPEPGISGILATVGARALCRRRR